MLYEIVGKSGTQARLCPLPRPLQTTPVFLKARRQRHIGLVEEKEKKKDDTIKTNGSREENRKEVKQSQGRETERENRGAGRLYNSPSLRSQPVARRLQCSC